jgi:hypothetical protein
LQSGLRTLPPSLATLFGSDGPDIEAAIRETAKQRSSELRERAAQELPLLPFSRCAGAALRREGTLWQLPLKHRQRQTPNTYRQSRVCLARSGSYRSTRHSNVGKYWRCAAVTVCAVVPKHMLAAACIFRPLLPPCFALLQCVQGPGSM